MSIRTILYTVTESGITPTTAQHGGVQGDHNATELKFTLPKTFIEKLPIPEGSTDALKYRFDGYSGSGLCKSTNPLPFEGITDDGITLTYPIEEWITRDGGNVQVLLVITVVSGDKTELELYSFPALIKLKNRPRGKSYDGNSHESITTLAEAAKDAESKAKQSAEAAKVAAISANGAADAAAQSAKQAESYKNEANGAADAAEGYVIKEAIIENEKLVIKYNNGNSVDLGNVKGDKGDTGSQGPKGDKGDTGLAGKDAVTDQTFDPESENAQSGVAVAEAAAPKANTTYVNNTFANALKGSASGEKAVAVSDVSPIEHNLLIKVKSKNLIPYPYTDTTKTENGITFTDNGDGTITPSGTASADANFIFATITLNAGTYTCSYGTAVNGCVVLIEDEKGSLVQMVSGEAYFTINTETKLVVKGFVTSGATPTGYFLPQIELGTIATDYTPHIDDLSDVTISRYGKNLFGVKKEDFESMNIQNMKVVLQLCPNTTYTLSSNATGEKYAVNIYFNGTSSQNDGVYQRQPRTKTTDESGELYVLVKKAIFDGIFTDFYIQLELGAAATEYEPYTEPITATADADGNVEVLTSVSPNMTIMSDMEGVVIDLEYNRDINKAFAELQQAILNNI